MDHIIGCKLRKDTKLYSVQFSSLSLSISLKIAYYSYFLFYFYFLAIPYCMWTLASTRIKLASPVWEAPSFNHWAT